MGEPSWERAVFTRLDSIERRLSRIEGGLVLAGFMITAAIAAAGALRLF